MPDDVSDLTTLAAAAGRSCQGREYAGGVGFGAGGVSVTAGVLVSTGTVDPAGTGSAPGGSTASAVWENASEMASKLARRGIGFIANISLFHSGADDSTLAMVIGTKSVVRPTRRIAETPHFDEPSSSGHAPASSSKQWRHTVRRRVTRAPTIVPFGAANDGYFERADDVGPVSGRTRSCEGAKDATATSFRNRSETRAAASSSFDPFSWP
jgi:hypothetical protein